ncbi:glycosyltransferase family 4 protein [Prevotella sp. E2-28]|uniref:glycosyltransferase family 4 protein n=1 Tax=Prevotella sp. E2-28 TaxID=2913620 RepID=UPI001EDB1064|nr:glycosyltransferase family 4 protein [Prevotella sp. E2-28]UKK54777.1 glycosyltransferase family 4 protein [Prevotella sp. E2-28]
MKILWFANTPCGATEKLTGKATIGGGWLYALSEEIIKTEGIELHIAFYWHQQMSPFYWKEITYHPVLMEREGTRVGRLINRFIMAHGNRLDKQALPRLMKIVENVQPDIIHIHGSEGNFGLIASRVLPCPVVLSIQGLLNPYYQFFYRGYTKDEISKNETLFSKLAMSGISISEKSFRRNAERERFILEHVHNIIGRTFWDEACSLALNPKRCYYKVGEIMRHDFYTVRWEKPQFSTPFVVTSTISSGIYKGTELVFKTAAVLKSAGFEFRWNIIGTDVNDPIIQLAQKKVKASAEQLGISLLGRKNASEMVQLMTAADLYVQVSHIENSPNSLCEAMLLGMPVIATFAGGTASMLENNIEGRLIQDGEPYSLAGMIMELAADFAKAKEYGLNAREKAQFRHNPKRVCEQLLNTYRSILQQQDV